MIVTTQGYVLRRLAYQDTSLIVTLYTQSHGIKDFIVKGARGGRGKSRQSFFQLLSHLEIVFYNKPTRELQTLTDYSLASPTATLHTHPVKMVYVMLLAEVFYKSVREHEPNASLYAFLHNCVQRLEAQTGHLFEVAAWFLLHLTGHLGFLPQVDERSTARGDWYFDIEEGTIERNAAAADPAGPALFALATTGLEGVAAVTIAPAVRKPLVGALLRYYRHHVEHFGELQSLAVFEEVFKG